MRNIKLLIIALSILILPYKTFALDDYQEFPTQEEIIEQYNAIREQAEEQQQELLDEDLYDFEKDYDMDKEAKTVKKGFKYIISGYGLTVAFPVSLIVTLIFFFVTLSHYKMVSKSHSASEYLNKETMVQNRIKDHHTGTTTNKTKIEKNN